MIIDHYEQTEFCYFLATLLLSLDSLLLLPDHQFIYEILPSPLLSSRTPNLTTPWRPTSG
jgi:hypothetical protein